MNVRRRAGAGLGVVALTVGLVVVALVGQRPSARGEGFAFDRVVSDRAAIRERVLGSLYSMEHEFSAVAVWWALSDACVRDSDLGRGACYDTAAQWLAGVVGFDVREVRTDDWAGAIGGAMNILYNETAKELGLPKISERASLDNEAGRPPISWLCVPDCASAIPEAN